MRICAECRHHDVWAPYSDAKMYKCRNSTLLSAETIDRNPVTGAPYFLDCLDNNKDGRCSEWDAMPAKDCIRMREWVDANEKRIYEARHRDEG